MADLTNVQALMSTIQDAVKTKFDKTKLLYVNKFEGSAARMVTDTFSWVLQEEDFGNSPIVASAQDSPVAGQGDYSQYIAGAVETRHVKAFTRDQLRAVLTPDKAYRVDATRHIARESFNQVARVYSTMEFVANSCIVDGTLKYVSNEENNRMNVSLTFPIKTNTAPVLWSHQTSSKYDADIFTQVQTWLDEFALSGQGVPDVMRMTTNVWRYIRDNDNVKTYFANVRYGKADTKGGVITREMVAEAFGWPTIELYDERAMLKFTASSAGAKNGSRVITLKEGTFGLRVGDKMLVRYANGSWASEVPITAISDGISVTLTLADADSNAIAVGDVLVAKPTYFPQNKVLFASNERSNVELVRCPFGIETSGGEIKLTDWYGLRIDAFEKSSEPGLAVYRRVWDKFGWRFNPRAFMSCTVL